MAKLRKQGFNAFGVEIDRRTMENGFQLFSENGWDPHELLRLLDEVCTFDDGQFDFIFSEQVFEHVADLNEVAREMANLRQRSTPRALGHHALEAFQKPRYRILSSLAVVPDR